MCLPNILFPVFMFAFIFHCRSFSPCWLLAFLNFSFFGVSMFFFLRNSSPLFSITRSISFSVARSVYGHVTTKFSLMGRLPHFLSYVAPLRAKNINNNNYNTNTNNNIFISITTTTTTLLILLLLLL